MPLTSPSRKGWDPQNDLWCPWKPVGVYTAKTFHQQGFIEIRSTWTQSMEEFVRRHLFLQGCHKLNLFTPRHSGLQGLKQFKTNLHLWKCLKNPTHCFWRHSAKGIVWSTKTFFKAIHPKACLTLDSPIKLRSKNEPPQNAWRIWMHQALDRISHFWHDKQNLRIALFEVVISLPAWIESLRILALKTSWGLTTVCPTVLFKARCKAIMAIFWQNRSVREPW